MSRKKIIVEVFLNKPYSASFGTLCSLVDIWDMKILSGGTNLEKSIIYCPYDKFKILFGKYPENKKEYEVPRMMLKFVNKIITK